MVWPFTHTFRVSGINFELSKNLELNLGKAIVVFNPNICIFIQIFVSPEIFNYKANYLIA
jgi:hypothetical protein